MMEKTQDDVAGQREALEALLSKGIINAKGDEPKWPWLQHSMGLANVDKVLKGGQLICQWTVAQITGGNTGSGTDDMKKEDLGYYVFTRMPFGKFNAATYSLDKTRAMWFIDSSILLERYFWVFKGDAGKTVFRVPPKMNPARDDYDPTESLKQLAAIIKTPVALNEVAILGNIPLDFVKAIAVTTEGEAALSKKVKDTLKAKGIPLLVKNPMDKKLEIMPPAPGVRTAPAAGTQHQEEKSVQAEPAETATNTLSKLYIFTAIFFAMTAVYVCSSRKTVELVEYEVLPDSQA